MLSVAKLNNNRARVNQHNTERGILKDKRNEIIEAVALTLAPKEYAGEEKTIDEQLSIMKREKDEKKLLDYQLKNNPQNVSTFLANKYADGNFNIAVKDRYDNSEERKKSGLTFDYHVYLPMEDRYNSKRGHNKYILSDTILDRSTGDNYTYHIPMYINSDGEVPYFVTDYGEVVDDSNARGLKWALQQLRIAIDSGKFTLDPLSEEILSQFGFLVDGKIVHDIKGDILVEKYLKSIYPPEKKAEAVKYLDSFVKDSSTVEEEKEPALEQPPVELEKEDVAIDPAEQLRAMLEKDGFVIEPIEQPPAAVVADVEKTVTITPGEYTKKSVAVVAKDNNIPVIKYVQTKQGNTPPVKEWLEVFTGDTVYKLGFRTGYKGGNLGTFSIDIGKYHKAVLSDVTSGKLTVAPLNKHLQDLLTMKGFSALIEGNKPPLVITNFDRAITL